ncbi:MAG: class I SAM-dependent methyltransferase [Verrucomicrobia bacterium]|nr:class I SAM-dependent methyltransferase [Verrucomicrobiota bacterium]
MDRTYWENYYKKHSFPAPPSLFAEFVSREHLNPGMHLIELGCGNGRDSVFFARNGVSVRGLDQVEAEIEFLNGKYAHENLEFVAGDFTRLVPSGTCDCVYSRFTLHSVSEEDELRVLKWAHSVLNERGLFCIEVRSVNDPKLQDGDRISPHENVVDGHYRRYFDLEKFKDRLIGHGLKIVFAEERTGFAPYGSEDPPVVRVVAQK